MAQISQLIILQGILLHGLHDMAEIGQLTNLKKLFYAQKINKCFVQEDEFFVYDGLSELLAKQKDLSLLNILFLPFWINQKIKQLEL